MAKRKAPFDFINLRGEPVRILAPAPAPPRSAEKSAPAAAAVTAAELNAVEDAVCLAGGARSPAWLCDFLRGLGRTRDSGAAWTAAPVGAALDALRLQKPKLPPSRQAERWHALVAGPDGQHAWRAYAWASAGGLGLPGAAPTRPVWLTDEQRVALLRLLLAARLSHDDFHQMLPRTLQGALTVSMLLRAFAEPLDPLLLARMQPALRNSLVAALDGATDLRQQAPSLAAWLQDAAARSDPLLPALRLRVAEWALHRGDLDAMRRVFVVDPSGCAVLVPVLEAAALAWQGAWQASAAAAAPALKALARALGRRRGLLPAPLLELLLLAPLALPDRQGWDGVRRLALAESGSRTPGWHGWGLWARTIAVRLGEEPTDPAAHEPQGVPPQPDALILAAWANLRPRHWKPALVAAMQTDLLHRGLPWKAALLGQAARRIGVEVADIAGLPPWPVQYFGAPPDAWRDALQSIGAIAFVGASADGSSPAAPGTLRWQLRTDGDGRLRALAAFEKVVSGVRGRVRWKPVPATRLAKPGSALLDPRDAAVARAFRLSQWSSREAVVDLAAAAAALVGHPEVVLADAPEQSVELAEGLPTLDVRRERQADGSERWRFHLGEKLLDTDDDHDDDHARRRGSAAARVVSEAPGRARLIRITPAQRQVAELASRDWSVPLEAQAELDAALRVLAGHFQLHSDALGGQTVAADPLLRAQFTPRGGAIELRLVVRPFGAFGPVLAPGSGRARLHTLHDGESLATERDLGAERAHLAAVVEALPFLDDADADAGWHLDDAEDALAAVERLAALPGMVAAVEWPKGEPMTLLQPAAAALQTRVSSGQDWFAVDGQLALDESRVVGLQQLLALLDGARGKRYVALGDGRYLALTQALRKRLDELAALAEPAADGLRLPGAAAAWLAEAAPALNAAGDRRWEQRARRLEEAAVLAPVPPAALQAELRPYQADGWTWMARLAHAGFGALLADDMGLGKTVQTLALLLARAGQGPALVVAPTSVCGNWAVEAMRFAPTLVLHDHWSAARDGAAERAGAGDVVIASYALLTRDAEALARVRWATLVLDEAQAVKNAATRRAQAIGGLDAGFRLALTGTPVENRLADLWSIMNLLNPGLLGSAARFAERFANPIERQRDEPARARLRRIVAPFLLRRTKAEVLAELPPRTEIVHRVEPGADERAFLEAARRRALDRIAAAKDGPQAAFQVLAELTRLRRAACDPRLVAPELKTPGAKVLAFERLAGELVAGGHQALVFSQFTDFLQLLGDRLQAAGIDYQYLDGGTPAAARADRVAAFQRGASPLFLISLKAGGFGLNLTAADYVIIADPWWNPAAEDQASGRAHRIGQQRPVTVYRLVSAGSVEERIVALHADKRALAEGLLGGQDGGRVPAAEELMALLRGVD